MKMLLVFAVGAIAWLVECSLLAASIHRQFPLSEIETNTIASGFFVAGLILALIVMLAMLVAG